jgi:hypothetical protein
MIVLKVQGDLLHKQAIVTHAGQLLEERPLAGGGLGIAGGRAGAGFERIAAQAEEAARAGIVTTEEVRGSGGKEGGARRPSGRAGGWFFSGFTDWGGWLDFLHVFARSFVRRSAIPH